MVYISHLYTSYYKFPDGPLRAASLFTSQFTVPIKIIFVHWTQLTIQDGDSNPPIIMPEGSYLNLLLTNDLSYHGWIHISELYFESASTTVSSIFDIFIFLAYLIFCFYLIKTSQCFFFVFQKLCLLLTDCSKVVYIF